MKEKIISDNAKLGLETRFFNEKGGVLGYIENGIVYLNEAYEDLEKINLLV
ncbi:MAG: hypothetical protein K2J11_09245 [Oscillospiraceae bacterium]|nr:hypothetical protein [Oscillospiraceae bacterium]